MNIEGNPFYEATKVAKTYKVASDIHDYLMLLQDIATEKTKSKKSFAFVIETLVLQSLEQKFCGDSWRNLARERFLDNLELVLESIRARVESLQSEEVKRLQEFYLHDYALNLEDDDFPQEDMENFLEEELEKSAIRWLNEEVEDHLRVTLTLLEVIDPSINDYLIFYTKALIKRKSEWVDPLLYVFAEKIYFGQFSDEFLSVFSSKRSRKMEEIMELVEENEELFIYAKQLLLFFERRGKKIGESYFLSAYNDFHKYFSFHEKFFPLLKEEKNRF